MLWNCPAVIRERDLEKFGALCSAPFYSLGTGVGKRGCAAVFAALSARAPGFSSAGHRSLRQARPHYFTMSAAAYQ
jgi:hypothetical protein